MTIMPICFFHKTNGNMFTQAMGNRVGIVNMMICQRENGMNMDDPYPATGENSDRREASEGVFLLAHFGATCGPGDF